MTAPSTFSVRMKDVSGAVIRQIANVTGWEVIGDQWIRVIVYDSVTGAHRVGATRIPAEVTDIVQAP